MKLFLSAALCSACLSAEGFSGGPAIESIIENAIHRDQLPGAVVLIGHKGRVVYKKAFGSRATLPQRESMTLDTVFDVASLTKAVATASSIMKLIEQGKMRLNDRVTEHIPEFQGGTSEITIRQLLTHFSGFRADVDLVPAWSGYDTGIRLAIHDKPTSAPGSRFVYSDINFVVLGEMVRRVAGSRCLSLLENTFSGRWE
ncbi:MAG: serine hydrolase domain-containing protein [Bryobacteraceae bacterium]